MDNNIIRDSKKIAVFRALQLGDMLCAIPAIRALKKANPQAALTLIGLPWAEDFVKRFSIYFSAFIPFPGAPGLQEQPFKVDSFIDYLRSINTEKFDLLIQMHGNGLVTNTITAMSGAQRMAGYYQFDHYCPDEVLFMPYPNGLPEIQRHLSLMEFLNVPSREDYLEFPTYPSEELEFAALCDAFQLKPRQYVCIHPGARDIKRWWAPQKFAQVANNIAEKGYSLVFTGTEGERAVVEAVIQQLEFPAINLTGKTDLGVLALLIKNARMLLSNDTGVSHVATAVKTPSVVIFLTSDPKRWAPIDRKRHHIILPEESDNVNYVTTRAHQALKYESSEQYA